MSDQRVKLASNNNIKIEYTDSCTIKDLIDLCNKNAAAGKKLTDKIRKETIKQFFDGKKFAGLSIAGTNVTNNGGGAIYASIVNHICETYTPETALKKLKDVSDFKTAPQPPEAVDGKKQRYDKLTCLPEGHADAYLRTHFGTDGWLKIVLHIFEEFPGENPEDYVLYYNSSAKKTDQTEEVASAKSGEEIKEVEEETVVETEETPIEEPAEETVEGTDSVEEFAEVTEDEEVEKTMHNYSVVKKNDKYCIFDEDEQKFYFEGCSFIEKLEYVKYTEDESGNEIKTSELFGFVIQRETDGPKKYIYPDLSELIEDYTTVSNYGEALILSGKYETRVVFKNDLNENTYFDTIAFNISLNQDCSINSVKISSVCVNDENCKLIAIRYTRENENYLLEALVTPDGSETEMPKNGCSEVKYDSEHNIVYAGSKQDDIYSNADIEFRIGFDASGFDFEAKYDKIKYLTDGMYAVKVDGAWGLIRQKEAFVPVEILLSNEFSFIDILLFTEKEDFFGEMSFVLPFYLKTGRFGQYGVYSLENDDFIVPCIYEKNIEVTVEADRVTFTVRKSGFVGTIDNEGLWVTPLHREEK